MARDAGTGGEWLTEATDENMSQKVVRKGVPSFKLRSKTISGGGDYQI